MKWIGQLGAGLAALAAVSAASVAADCACDRTTPDITGVWAQPWARDLEKIDKSLIAKEETAPAVFTPAYRKKYQMIHAIAAGARGAKGAGAKNAKSDYARVETACLPYGMPKMMEAGYSVEILRRGQQYTLVGEAMLEVRRIYLDTEQLPLSDVDLGYEGRSVGHWEGDTLVVSTIGVKESVIGPNDLVHSKQMVINERIKLLTPDLLQDRITITDPEALAQPYELTETLLRRTGYETPEYVCDNKRERIDANGKLHLDVKAESK